MKAVAQCRLHMYYGTVLLAEVGYIKRCKLRTFYWFLQRFRFPLFGVLAAGFRVRKVFYGSGSLDLYPDSYPTHLPATDNKIGKFFFKNTTVLVKSFHNGK